MIVQLWAAFLTPILKILPEPVKMNSRNAYKPDDLSLQDPTG